MKLSIIYSAEFIEWLNSLEIKSRAQVDARIIRLESDAHFGDAKYIGAGLAELRWNNGRRAYYTKISTPHGLAILFLLGGDKNGQKNDIKKAKFLLRRYAISKT